MNEHFTIGHRYPDVKISTSYSFGLDDQEFVLGFETDNPGTFLDLVMDLREASPPLHPAGYADIHLPEQTPECLDDLG